MAIKSQGDQRRGQVMKDQHGREWSGSIETKSGFPTGIVFHQFWIPRHELVPPQKYLKYYANDSSKIHIDYTAWIKDLEDAGLEYENRKIQFANAIPGGAQSPMLPQLLGPAPMSPVPVKAMQQGNKWALGLSREKPPEADAFFPEPLVLQESPVFSGPVFTEDSEAPMDESQIALRKLEEISARAPENLKGAAKANWILRELKGENQPQEA